MSARALLAVAALALSACYRDPLGMIDQKKALPYAPSALFEDGRAMRPLPAGTIAQESPRGREVVLTGLEGGREAARIPVPLTRPLLQRGRHDFEIWCATCHGVLGDGQSAVARKMALRPPPSLLERDFTPGHVFVAASDGYGLMPSYASELSVEERWGVVAYVFALRRSQSRPIDEAPPDVRRALQEEHP
jgi:mono/diheme cytochrome c family protein